MDLLTWFDESFRLRIALTLLHFLWQGCVMMLVVLLAGWMLRRAPAAWRYLINLAAMLMMAACLPVTFVLLEPSHACEARRDTTETAMSPLLGGRSEVDEDRAMQLNNASPELAMAPCFGRGKSTTNPRNELRQRRARLTPLWICVPWPRT